MEHDNTIRPVTNPETSAVVDHKSFPGDFLVSAFSQFQQTQPQHKITTLAGYREALFAVFPGEKLLAHKMAITFNSNWRSEDYHQASRQVFAPRTTACLEAFKENLLKGLEPGVALTQAAENALVGAREEVAALNIPVPFVYVPPAPEPVVTKKPRRKKTAGAKEKNPTLTLDAKI